jgi:hypothetical protein
MMAGIQSGASALAPNTCVSSRRHNNVGVSIGSEMHIRLAMFGCAAASVLFHFLAAKQAWTAGRCTRYLVVSNGQMVTYTFRNMLFWYFSFRLLRRLDSIKFKSCN